MGVLCEWPHCSVHQLLPSVVSIDKVDGIAWHGRNKGQTSFQGNWASVLGMRGGWVHSTIHQLLPCVMDTDKVTLVGRT
jgi:hypothetical protein